MTSVSDAPQDGEACAMDDPSGDRSVSHEQPGASVRARRFGDLSAIWGSSMGSEEREAAYARCLADALEAEHQAPPWRINGSLQAGDEKRSPVDFDRVSASLGRRFGTIDASREERVRRTGLRLPKKSGRYKGNPDTDAARQEDPAA